MNDAQYTNLAVSGGWFPEDSEIRTRWLDQLIAKVDDAPAAKFHPVIQEFQNLIESDPQIFMYFHLMFSEVPNHYPYNKNPDGDPQVRDYHHMLQLMNEIMTHGSEYNTTLLVGFPFNAIFDWSMGTTAGFAAFLNKKVNRQLKRILDEWGIYLTSSDSTTVLNDNPKTGWLGTDALAAMVKKAMPAGNPEKLTFDQIYKCDKKLPHYGFTSWDNFFTREYRDKLRPIACPDDSSIIVNACESAPFISPQGYRTHVQKRNKFWIKGQPYSLEHLLANDPLVDKFVGGTVYQAFLSAISYHRWHSPVSGEIIKAYVEQGTYYSEALIKGFQSGNPDQGGPNESQGYIAHLATRAIIFIEADNPDIGLMCVVPIGMAEVSTCEITVYEGQKVKKGDQLGMFHFGGSTHCLLFGPQVELDFDLRGLEPSPNGNINIPINAKIAKVVS